jgi:hypothetical protein
MIDVCKTCNGIGAIEKEGKLYECECSVIRRISASMPPYVRNSEVLPGHISLKIIDEINKSYFIISSWPDMKAIIKAAMIKHSNKFIKLIGEREIVDVFVGSKSANARKAMKDEDAAVYNNLEDLMSPPFLAIVKLNELSYKNKAASGALEEAISYRLDKSMPIWIFSDMDKPFSNSSFAYSDSVMDLIQSSILKISIPRVTPRQIMNPNVLRPESVNPINSGETRVVGPVLSESEPKPKVRIKSIPDEEPLEGSLSMYGKGLKKKPFQRNE